MRNDSSKFENVALSKRIKPHHLFTIGFGTIIGVGWMIVAGNWVAQAGPVGASLAFVLGGLVIFIIALCYSEMGMLYPQSGGEVVYVYEAFGPLASFSVGWLLTLFFVSITAFEAIAAAWMVDVLIPGYAGWLLYSFAGADVYSSSVLLGLFGMVVLCYANYRGGGTAARVQDILTFIFAGGSLLFIISGIAGGAVANASPLIRYDEGGWIFSGIVAVLVTVPVWYSGFNTVPQTLGEIADTSDPRLLVRGLGLALLASALFYIGVIFSMAVAAPAEVYEGTQLPVAVAIFSAFESPWPGRLVLIAGLLGIVTSWNAMFFAAARVLFALSRARIVPTVLSRVHPRFGSPTIAVVFVGAVGGIGVFAGRGVLEPIINTIGICLATVYLFVCAALLRLRRVRPDIERPYSVPAFPHLPRAAFASSLIILILALIEPWRTGSRTVPLEWLVLIIWCVLGVLIWRASKPLRSSITEDERRNYIHGQ